MATPPLRPGLLIDERFELVEPLPSRGCGETWRARNVTLANRPVTLKLLAEGAGGEALAELLRRVRALRHKDLAAATGQGAWGGRPYVLSAWFDGAPLDAPDALAPPELPSLLDRVIGAIEAAHGAPAPVIHGALTPGCVLVRREGGALEVRVADFGLRRFAEAGSDAAWPEFAAPELLFAPDPTPAADLYALGALLRHALAAPARDALCVSPFEGYRGRANVGVAVWDVVARAAARDPAARFESVTALRAALRAAWADDARLPTRPADELPPPPARAAADAAVSAAPPMVWAAPAVPPAPRKPSFDEQKTTYKLPSLPSVAPSAPAQPLSLDALLGDAAPPPPSTPPPPPAPPTPTGAENPWATEVLRREVHVLPPVPTGAHNPWATDMIHGRTPPADDAFPTTVAARPAAPAAPSPHAPSRARWVVWAVAALLIAAGAAAALLLR